MSLFRKQVTRYFDANGKRVTKTTPDATKVKERSKVWSARYRDADGIVREVKLFRDKTASQQKLAELRLKAEHGKAGLVSCYDESARKPLKEHLADWLKALQARNCSAGHVTKLGNSVQRVVDACGWKRLKDLSSTAAEQYLAERREPVVSGEITEPGLSFASSNDHVAALKNFGNWLIKGRPKRWPENPFDGVGKLNADEDVRLERRPATLDEFRRLLVAASSGMPFRGLTGTDRVMLYLVASETGLRANELASLSVGSLDLDARIPAITVEAASSKRRRRDVQPIRPELAARLRTWLSQRERTAASLRLRANADVKLWPGTWSEKGAVMLRRDLDAAGVPFEDTAGRRLDFHSLRGTFATNLAMAGVSPKAAQELMRHSDINLTMRTYTQLSLVDVAADLSKLPSLPTGEPQTLRATGTDASAARSDNPSRLVARMVARAGEKTGLGLMTVDDSAPSEMGRESPPSTNEKTPVWQGFEDDCGLVMIAENPEPPVRFELTTYALRKHRSTN